MKNKLSKFILIIILLAFTYPLYAQSTKMITLQDGSILKGKVIEFKDNIYTLDTSQLGQLEIHDSDILSISSDQSSLLQNLDQSEQFDENLSRDSIRLQKQVEGIQGTILTDRNIMLDIQSIIENEEIMSILSDQEFIDDILSYDPERIEQNEKVQDLLQHPEMQLLIEKINQKLSTQDIEVVVE